MLLAIVVLVNGAFVASSPPVRVLFGHLVAPLGPVVARIADRVTLTGDTIALTRDARTCLFRVGSPAFRCGGTIRQAGVTTFARNGIVFVPLAPVVDAFGGSVAFDARSGTVAVTLPPRSAIATPTPFDAAAPRAAPTQVFTPQPPAPTPRVMESGDPRPRRTAIPTTPSRAPDG